MRAMSPTDSENTGQTCQLLERHWLNMDDPQPQEPLAPDLIAHLATCPSCQARRQSYQRLIGRLAQPPRGRGPRPGWSAEVLAKLRSRPTPRRPVRSRVAAWGAGGSLVLAAAVAIAIFVRTPEPIPPWTLPVETAVRPVRQAVLRAGEDGQPGGTAAPGDQLSIRFVVRGAARADVRVYLGRELVFTCAHGEGKGVCQREGDRLAALVPLSLAGRYEPLLVWSDHPLPSPAEGSAEDAARLVGAGARVQALDPIVVR
jgi:hypothetical protein